MKQNIFGVDVSHWQGVIDWARVAQKVSFAYIKCSDGTQVDSLFAGNWKMAGAAGVTRGAYHFFRPHLDPILQAGTFANRLRAAGAVPGRDLIPALDVEETSVRASENEWTVIPRGRRAELILAFAFHLRAIFGVLPLLYTRRNWLEENLTNPDVFRDVLPLWIAQYSTDLPTEQHGAVRLWQYSCQGRVDGITVNVDLDATDDLEPLRFIQSAAASTI
jgi:lysozyme